MNHKHYQQQFCNETWALAPLSGIVQREPKLRPAGRLLHELQSNNAEIYIHNKALRQKYIELETSRDHYINLYDFAPVGYLTATVNGQIVDINLKAATMLDMERDEIIGCNFAQFVADQDKDLWHRLPLSMQEKAGGEERDLDLILVRNDKSSINVHISCLRMSVKDGPETLRISLIDITKRKQVEDFLREQEEFFRMIAENGEDFIAVLDLEGRHRYNNRAYTKLFDDIQSIKGTDSFAQIHPDDRQRIKQAFKETVQSGISLRVEFRFVLTNGVILHIESCGGLIKNSQGEASCVVVVSRDVTNRKQVEDEIHNLAFYDPLTRLPNRRLLNDRLSQTIAASKRSGCYGALMFLDLDNFKPVNDLHGHAMGDLLLIEVSKRIKNCVREIDTIARFGGDEFVVILSELVSDKAESTTQAGIVAEKIRTSISEPCILTIKNGEKPDTFVEHHCTACIGIALFLNHEACQDDIVKWADAAMFQAKKTGRNLIQFYDSDS